MATISPSHDVQHAHSCGVRVHFRGLGPPACALETLYTSVSLFLSSWTTQIDFLNSVIVDLQRKNQDLKMKVEMMSEAALNGNGDDLNNYDRYF